jgi:dolichyl-phosphate-mannose-protein mannosyltransferase
MPMLAAMITAVRAPRWSRADTIALVAITTLAAAIRLVRLGDPDSIMFDETYYAKDSCWYANTSTSLCDVEGEQTGVHPPLGKWLLAAGIRVFGYDSFGWRFAAAIAGVVTVALLYLLARRLFRSTLAASLTAGLLALDSLHFVQSRIAMLDVFVPLFGLAAVLFVVIDRDVVLAGGSGAAPREGRRIRRPWRLAAGAAAGAATASKWSGAFFVVLIIVLSVVWEVAARRERGEQHPFTGAVRGEWSSMLAYLVLVPVLVYGATFIGQVHGSLLGAPWSEGAWLRAWWDRQIHMADFHFGLEASHPYQSPPWSWILVRRPVSYFYEATATGERAEILALGNPILWWASIPALAFVVYRWARRRNYRGPEGVILAGFVVTYGPWLLQQTDRSAVFLFYLLPSVPFMYLAIGRVASVLGSSWEAKAAVAIVAALAAGSFSFFYPVMAKVPLPVEQWSDRMWYQSCDRAPARTTTSTTIEERRRATITRTNITTLEESPPPRGWCWI